MSRRFILSKAAERDLREAADYYARENPQLAREFLDEIRANLDEIRADPEQWPVWPEDEHYRKKVVLRRFPFVIFYTVKPRAVTIRAVAHGKRRPGYFR